MSNLNDAKKIQELSDDYYNKKITRQEYRERRKNILNKIDLELNGISAVTDDEETSLVGKMMSYFKTAENEKDTV